MSIIYVAGILFILLVYIVSTIHYMNKRKEYQYIDFLVDDSVKEEFRMLSFERKLLKSFDLKPDKVKTIIYTERALIICAGIVLFYFLKGLMLTLVGAIVIIVTFGEMYKKLIFESGITLVPKVNNFINYFIPHIDSGHSADQSLLGYIKYSGDKDLLEFFENKDNPDFKIKIEIKQIVDIYELSKYNEEQGNSDYTYILEELSEDIAQKQVYYNTFVSKISEIQPIVISYYLGVPTLIIISFQQTSDFWLNGIGGYVVSLILLVLFGLFKFLIYKIQKKTITTIF